MWSSNEWRRYKRRFSLSEPTSGMDPVFFDSIGKNRGWYNWENQRIAYRLCSGNFIVYKD